ncbi:DUF982 domain-containing protein [Neorhizobium sp. T786]|uniref:DUF982 domain-containing protein n=1 Tax=Pseudorhizobium xiangyangii TaxID=2883104 RepID=UPI001CFFC932|nr:DUF982 domain-containing protein [Neorhizobium xiangyangii]MCB5205475.1 DUF982 domain-containing protein [Neorhizobium xiangyangii]
MTIEWRALVRIRIGTGSADLITGPNDAFEALSNRWPAERGPHYKDAKRLCSIAIGGGLPPEVAREAFIAAALEAAVLA